MARLARANFPAALFSTDSGSARNRRRVMSATIKYSVTSSLGRRPQVRRASDAKWTEARLYDRSQGWKLFVVQQRGQLARARDGQRTRLVSAYDRRRTAVLRLRVANDRVLAKQHVVPLLGISHQEYSAGYQALVDNT